ncbi:MAG TPA: PAS-domain containing protein [Acetobacteraceae bacterium]|jgi:PAS domain-containing protein
MSVPPGRRRRRRRRTHSSALRRTPEQLRARHHRRAIGKQELLVCGAVAVVCIALIVLIWINTVRASRDEAEDTRVRTEAVVQADANILADQVDHELTEVEQSLTLLQSSWNTNPQAFNLVHWRAVLPVLTNVAQDIFIANDKHIIVQDIIPQAVGQGIGSAYANFANGSLEPIVPEGQKDAGKTEMLEGELGASGVQREYVLYLVRPLISPRGWLIGASYNTAALAKLFESASLGMQGVVALVDSAHGGVQAVVGTAALQPRLNLSNTPMFDAMTSRPDGGVWIGRTAIDGVQRILAFRRVPGRNLMVIAGVGLDDAMAPAENWADGADSVALAASVLVILIGIAVVWELFNLRANRRRRRAVAQADVQIDALRADLETARGRAGLSAAQVQALLEATSDGVAVVDAELHLAGWNPRFAAGCGLPADALQEAMPLDDLVRQQANAGMFGVLEDVEAEVANRVTQLRSGQAIEMQPGGPDAPPLEMDAQVLPDGGLMLILHGVVPRLTHEPEATAATEEV